MKLYAGSNRFFAFHVIIMILIMVFAYIDETVSLYLSVFWIFSMIAEGLLGVYQERLGILHTENQENHEEYCEYCGSYLKKKE